MKSRYKKILSAVLTMAICLSTLAPSVYAAEKYPDGSTLIGDIAQGKYNGDYVEGAEGSFPGGGVKTEFVKISHPENPASKREHDPTKSPEEKELHKKEVFADGLVDYISNGLLGVPHVDEGANGQGCRGETYSWTGIGYGDWMYVSTQYNSAGATGQIMGHEPDPENLEEVYGGDYYYEEFDKGVPGSTLSKINVKTGEVKILMAAKTNGLDAQFRSSIEYKGKLYFCGSVNHVPSIYEVDPTTDVFQCVYQDESMINHPGGIGAAWQEAKIDKRICPAIRGLTVFNDYLIISCVGLDENPYIAVSNDPSSGKFTKIASAWKDVKDPDTGKVSREKGELFGYPACHLDDSIFGGSIWEMIPFNGDLYVAMCTGTPDTAETHDHKDKDGNIVLDKNGNPVQTIDQMQSFALVRGEFDSSKSISDPTAWNWVPIAGDKADGAEYTFGIDPERHRAGACNLVVFGDHLYIGEYNDTQIAFMNMMDNEFTFLKRNMEESISLYRMNKNGKIEKVMGNPTTLFPNSVSGVDESGFGQKSSQYIWQSKVFNNKLYLGTFDETMVLQPLANAMNQQTDNQAQKSWSQSADAITSSAETLLEMGNGQAPTDPEKPVEPEIPSEPVVPEVPSEPTEPEDKPAEPSEPAEPEVPETPSEPSEPEVPSEPEEPAEPEVPENKPAEPSEPTEPEVPETPSKPTEPEAPSAPVDPALPDAGTAAASLSEPAEPEVPENKPADSEKPAEPEVPEVPSEPTEPEVPENKPAEPSEPTEPEVPENKPSKPEKPAKPEEPELDAGFQAPELTEEQIKELEAAQSILDMREFYESKKESDLFKVDLSDVDSNILLPSSVVDSEPLVKVDSPESLYLAILAARDLMGSKEGMGLTEQLAANYKFLQLDMEIKNYVNTYSDEIPSFMMEPVNAVAEQGFPEGSAGDLFYVIQNLKGCVAGFDMYATSNGTKFKQVTRSGLGDPFNQGLRVFASNIGPDASSNPWMCIGSANPFYGTQIWRMNDRSLNPSIVTPKQLPVKVSFFEGEKEIRRDSDKPAVIYIEEGKTFFTPEQLSILLPTDYDFVDPTANIPVENGAIRIPVQGNYKDVTLYYIDAKQPEDSTDNLTQAKVKVGKSRKDVPADLVNANMPEGYELEKPRQRIKIEKNADGLNFAKIKVVQIQNPVECTVTFDANGGTGAPIDSIKTMSGSKITLPECTFTGPEGKTFKGWAMNSADGQVFAAGSEVTIPAQETITFYAVWDIGEVAPGLKGDVNEDGEITAADAQRIFAHINGEAPLAEDKVTLGDINGDGDITAADAQCVFAHINGENPLA